MALIATQPILYGFKTYKPGETLPVDEVMKPLWLESGAAIESTEKQKKSSKAIPAAATAGKTGTVDGAATQDGTLVGVVRKRNKKAT